MKKFYSIFTGLSVAIAICLASIGYSQGYNVTLTPQCNTVTAGTETLSFTGTFPNANGNGTLTVYYGYGDLGSNTIEYLNVSGETGPAWPNATHSGGDCAQYYDSVTYTIPMADINAWASTGSQIDFTVVASSAVNNFCTNGTLSGLSFCTYGKLTYPFATVPNDAGASAITPTLVCPGSDSVKVKINNYGTNQIDSVWVNWRKNGTLQTPIHLKTLLDTATGTSPSFAIVNLGLHTFTAGNTETFEVWTTLPNGVADTTTANDTTVANIKPSLTGTYTIGGTSPDYTTWNLAVADLVANGICGPVTFNVRQGTYNEQIDLPSINGSSSTNTITFQNDPANTAQAQLSFAGTNSTNNYVVKLSGVEHVTFDSLIFNATSSSIYGYIFHFNTASNYITIKNNTLNGITNQTTSLASIVYLNGNTSSNVTIDNNTMNNGSYVMYYRGPSTTSKGDSLQFTNNTANDYRYYGVYLYYQDDVKFENNTLHQITTATSLGYGVFAGYCERLKFKANDIELYGTSTNYGLYLNRCYGTVADKVEVINNMIKTSPNAGGTAYGIYDNYNLHANIYHNSVNVRGGNPTSARAFMGNGSNSTIYGNINVRNNVFVNDGGYALYTFSGATTGYYTNLDNNIYFSNAANKFYWGTTAHATFAAYQTASSVDSNSYFGVPGFLSQTDLHLQGALAADSGANVGVMVDIDGDVRPIAPSTGYDIGADEYIPPTCPMGYNLNAFNLSATTADVTWIPGVNDSMWIFEYGAPGFTPGTGTSLPSTNDTATITGLTPVTFYDVYVRGICGAGDTSLYFGPFNFRTRCVSTLSGNYTIDNSSPTAGTNYNSFADAVAALNNCGVSGPTVFHVDEGTYTEQVTLISIVGASATNTITFKADSSNTNAAIVTYGASSSLDNFVFRFDGAEHIIIDSLTINPTGTTFAYAIYFPTTAKNIVIKDNVMNGNSTSTSSLASVIYNQSGASNMVEDIEIDNNTINNGSYGVYWWGGSTAQKEKHLKFTNNKVEGFRSYGSYFYYQDSALIEGNEFKQDITSTSFGYGVLSYYLDDSKVSKNKIEMNTTSTNYGIMVGRYAGASNEVSNNFIVTSARATGTAYGIYVNYCLNTNVYHNSTNIRAGLTTSTRALYVTGSTSTLYGNVDIRNNIFTNQAGGYASYVQSGAASTYLSHLDHNIYNSPGANPFYYGTTTYATFALYQAGSMRDSNSFFSSPGYFSQSDLHLQGIVAHDAGDSTLGVMSDIDDDMRPLSPTTGYDIGADEYIPPTCPSPYSIVLDSVGTTFADISWTNGPADSIWEIQYGAPGFTLGTGTTVNLSSNPATISGLTHSTCYDVWLRSICTVGDTSIWTGPFNFCTNCAAVSDYCTNFDSDAINSTPFCWKTYINTTASFAYVQTIGYSSFSTPNCVRMYNQNDASGTFMLIAPEVTTASAGTHRMNVNVRADTTVIVGTMSDPTNPGTFVPWDTLQGLSNSSYKNYRIPFTVAPAGHTSAHVYPAILWSPGATYDNVYIDDYCWEMIPSCEKAPAVTILNAGVDSTSLNVGWNYDTTTGASAQVSYIVAYGDSNFDPITSPATGDTVYSTTNFKQITGLRPLTKYCVWVKAVCANGDTSAWSGPHCGSTGCPSGVALPYMEDFTTYRSVWPMDETPQCWEEATGGLSTSGSVSPMTESFWEPDGFGNVGFQGAARFHMPTFGTREGWLLTPTFNFGPDPNVARIIEFDVALTQQYNTSVAPNGFGDDDTVALVVSYDRGVTWKTADIIMQWDTSNEPSNTGTHVVYIMRNTTGYVKFGFFGASSVANEGVEFHLDNFSIRDTTWVGIDEPLSSLEEFQVYPNPNTGIFTVLNTGKAKTSSIKMMDIQGRKVYDSQLSFSQNGTKEIQVENLKSGVYILLIQSEGKLEQHRVVIQ